MPLIGTGVALAILLIGIFAFTSKKNESTQDTEWRYPGFSQYTNTFFHHQTQITSGNANKLEMKWRFEFPQRDPPVRDSDGEIVQGSWTAPLVIKGKVYTATMDNQFFSLDARSGKLLCKNEVPNDKIKGRVTYSTRGVTSYNGSIVLQAADCSVYAFDPDDCHIKWVMPSTCRDIPGNKGFNFGMNPPLFFNDHMFISSGGAETGIRGYMAAYNITTKKLLWRWFSVPPAIEGPKNWAKEAAKGNIAPYPNDWGTSSEIGGGHVWAWPVIDTEKNVLFVGTGNPSPDLNASTRPGPNLYTDSVVALNISNGEMLWYYQLNSHEMYDHDISASLMFGKIPVNGNEVKIVVAVSKSGHVLVLDAQTGKPLYAPIALSQQYNNFNDNNPQADFTAQSPDGKIVCPGNNGGMQASPALTGGIIYAVAQDMCRKMISAPITTRDSYFAGKSIGIGTKDNSTLYAIDAATGKILWSFFMDATYRKGSVTVSGDLVIAGDDKGVLHILRRDNGGLLYESNTESPVGAPITLGSDSKGDIRIFVPFGSRGARGNDVGILALGLPG